MKYIYSLLLLAGCVGTDAAPPKPKPATNKPVAVHVATLDDVNDVSQALQLYADVNTAAVENINSRVEELEAQLTDIEGRLVAVESQTDAHQTQIEILAAELDKLNESPEEVEQAASASASPVPSSPKANPYAVRLGRQHRGIIITSTSCIPCNQMKQNELPKLQATGWTVGDEQNNIELVDLNTPRGQSYLRQNGWNGATQVLVPTILRVVDGEIVDSRTGFMSATSLATFINNGTAQASKGPREIIVHGRTESLQSVLTWYNSNSGYHAPNGENLWDHCVEDHGCGYNSIKNLPYETVRKLHIALHLREDASARRRRRA